MKILGTYNIKGGVGKTASAVNLAYCAFKRNLRVLVWDLDPQGAASYYFRIKPKIEKGVRKLIQKKKVISRSIKATNFDGLDLIPADFSFRNMDIFLNMEKKSELRFKKLLMQVSDDYDLLIMDCPPSISLVSENVFYAANALLVPTIPTHLSFRAYDQLKKFINSEQDIHVSLFPYLYMVDRRKLIHQQFVDKFHELYSEGLKTQISNSSVVEKMGIYRAPIELFDRSSHVCIEFNNLWNEIWDRIN